MTRSPSSHAARRRRRARLLFAALALALPSAAVAGQEGGKPAAPAPPTQNGGQRPTIESTSPVPASSGLYPGSTVREFRGKDNFGFETNLDFRFRDSSREENGVYLAAGRLTGDWVRANPANRDERGGVRLQLVLETDSKGTVIESLRFSEAYAYYTFLSGGVSARARLGQFVLPFGLIAVYDTPLQPIQPLYEKALGVRVDTGVMLEGRWGPYQYAGSFTTGSGPNRSDFDGNKVASFRLGRTIETRFGDVELGGSLLTGRLPVTSFETELPPSGTSGAREFVDKTRFAVDGQFARGAWLGRGEIIFGADDEDQVFGYFLEGNYRATPRLAVVAYSKRWDFPTKPQRSTGVGIGLNYQATEWLVLRSLFEYERDVPLPEQGDPFVIKRFTVQTQIRF